LVRVTFAVSGSDLNVMSSGQQNQIPRRNDSPRLSAVSGSDLNVMSSGQQNQIRPRTNRTGAAFGTFNLLVGQLEQLEQLGDTI